MLVGSKQRLNTLCDQKLNVSPFSHSLQCVSEYKCLGVIIDNSLDFRKHVENITTVVKQKLGVIRRSKHLFNQLQMNKLYWGYIVPHLLYCCCVWCERSATNYDALNRLHKRAAYMISERPWQVPSEEVFHNLGWLELNKLFSNALCSMIHKCVHKMVPQILYDKFFLIEDISTRTTRSTNKKLIRLPKCKTSFYQSTFLYSGPKLWNELPETTRSISNNSTFKAALKQN